MGYLDEQGTTVLVKTLLTHIKDLETRVAELEKVNSEKTWAFLNQLNSYNFLNFPYNTPPSANYGMIIGHNKTSYDKYYIAVTSGGKMYAGTQVNNAATVTWTEK